MNGNQKFFICSHCGNIASLVLDKGAPLSCCGQKMDLLTPNTAEASVEKHLPVITVSNGAVEVKIGSAPHPMEEAHHIVFVYVETEKGGQRKNLNAGEKPELSFNFADDKAVNVYAYCNLHGLWKTEVK